MEEKLVGSPGVKRSYMDSSQNDSRKTKLDDGFTKEKT